jgi:hypothetical protein
MESENLASFYFKDTVDGTEHDYRLTCNNGQYEVENDGLLIATLAFFGDWKQVAGEPLHDSVLAAITEQIENHNK